MSPGNPLSFNIVLFEFSWVQEWAAWGKWRPCIMFLLQRSWGRGVGSFPKRIGQGDSKSDYWPLIPPLETMIMPQRHNTILFWQKKPMTGPCNQLAYKAESIRHDSERKGTNHLGQHPNQSLSSFLLLMTAWLLLTTSFALPQGLRGLPQLWKGLWSILVEMPSWTTTVLMSDSLVLRTCTRCIYSLLPGDKLYSHGWEQLADFWNFLKISCIY